MITIAELFPLYRTACKWLTTFRKSTSREIVRLEKEYTVIRKTQGYLYIEEFTVDKKYHRSDGPAYVSKGHFHAQEWFYHGELHRKHEPAVIHYFENGEISSKSWYERGKLHRRGGPAHIAYYRNGKIGHIDWYKNGILL